MDRIPLSPLKRPHKTCSRSALWIAGTSAFLFTGFASGSDDSGHHIASKASIQVDHPSSGTEQETVAILPSNRTLVASVASAQDVPTIDPASFNERFSGPVNKDVLRATARPLDFTGGFSDAAGQSSGRVAASTNARRERAVHSLIGVDSQVAGSRPGRAEGPIEPRVDISALTGQTRPDLLSGVPTNYAKLALTVAGKEGVDPNWVLSVMRAENAAFDPELVSPAGAIGLMQVMPRIGEAFGATDLTDPLQNIRAGTRFLRVLIKKYQNPVLVAAAYNAGEPNVDLRHSLPLIRETADYVTRVVGYYTGTSASPSIPRAGSPSEFVPSSKRRTGPAERAKSPMLVFSAATPSPPDVRPERDEAQNDAGGPVKIVKEEVSQ